MPPIDASRDTTRSRTSTPGEVADAAAVAALVFTSAALGRLLAFGTFFQLLSTVVFVVLASRRRTRTVVMAGTGGVALGLILGGIGPLSQIGAAALFGGLIGSGFRRGWGRWRTIVYTVLVATPVVSAGTIAYLLIFSRARELNFENAENLSEGMARFLGWLGLGGLGDGFVDLIAFSIRWWWAATPVVQVFISLAYAWFTARIAHQVVRRVDSALGPATNADIGPIGSMLPIELAGAAVRRDGTELTVVEGRIAAGDLVLLRGPNGVGKSTLLDALAGLGSATVDGLRPLGFGHAGGVSLIGQRPDAQVLSLVVEDELAWCGASPERITELLDLVGLSDLRHRTTSTLSGGELQRLAIAAALSRDPELLLSDESTSMLDPESRATVMQLLKGATDNDMAVLHTTHLSADSALADHVIAMGNTTPSLVVAPEMRPPTDVIMRADGVSVTHDAGSPWAVPALHSVDLELRRGELTLITGGNGSGKSTLAWTLAGLHRPTTGRIELDGEQMDGPSTRVALAFQHARLQLLNDTVPDEVRSMSGVEDVDYELRAVGLDPITVGDRRVDQLSGGEQRRLLLAGILSSRPDVVVLDEPLAGLDDEGRERLRSIVQRLLARRAAVAVVSHEPHWADDLIHQRIELSAGSVSSRESIR